LQPRAAMFSKRRLLGAGIVALVATLLLLWIGSDRDDVRPGADGDRAHATTSREAPRDPIVRAFPDPAQEETPGVHCWEGLLEQDRAGSFASYRELLGRAVASGDDLLATYLQDRLAELIGGDVVRAMQLLDWTVGASPRELEILLGALRQTPAVQDRTVSRRLLAMAEDAAAGDHHRAIALGTLETQHRLPTEDLARLGAIAVDPDAGDTAWAATRAVGRVMKEDFDRTGSYQPYLDQLLAISRTTTVPAVRVLALEMPAYSDPIVGGAYLDELAQLLTNAPEREVREMAAFQLGVSDDPDRVVGIFRAAFPREPDRCVRWAIFRFTVRAAGAGSFPALEDYARVDPRFRADLDDFRRIYATGIADFERVWLDKEERHPCSADEDPAHEG
jgi:hypothetical protein